MDPSVVERTQRIREKTEQRASLLERCGPQHIMVQQLDKEIESMEMEKDAEVKRLTRVLTETRIEDAHHTKEAFELQYMGLAKNLDDARKAMQDVSLKLERYAQIAEEAHDAKARRDKAADVLDQVHQRNIRPDAQRIGSRDSVATDPTITFPKGWIVMSMAELLFLSVALGIIFMKEMLDQRIKSPLDIKAIPQAELLGILPDAAEDPSEPTAMEGIVRRDPAGLMAEAFRQARTALLARMDRRGYKTLMVTCAAPRSGVSTVTSNLGLSLAYSGRRTLVIDANLRRPNQHKLFDCPDSPGLVEVLRGTATLETAIVHRTDPDLDVLPAGASRDAAPELLDSAAFRSMLTTLESRYDIILIDSPPMLLTSDCQMLAKHADSALLVVRAMADKRGMVGRMIRQFEGTRTDIVGVLLNGARSSVGGYFKENYEQFYRYRHPAALRPAARRPAPARAGSR
jgi:capsular exopolysaccharide synthesis family protein